jgi:hypothetical protein
MLDRTMRPRAGCLSQPAISCSNNPRNCGANAAELRHDTARPGDKSLHHRLAPWRAAPGCSGHYFFFGNLLPLA